MTRAETIFSRFQQLEAGFEQIAAKQKQVSQGIERLLGLMEKHVVPLLKRFPDPDGRVGWSYAPPGSGDLVTRVENLNRRLDALAQRYPKGRLT